MVILPFIPEIIERMKRLLKNYQIKVATKPLRSGGNMLPSLKEKINKLINAVFRVAEKSQDTIHVFLIKHSIF